MAGTAELRLHVNGSEVELDVEPSATLAQVLRDQLGLTGTKIGCEEGECGACTVLVDGTPVNSCIYPALKAAGRNVLTIEGLANDDALHPVQEAFLEEGAMQCGYCTGGMILAAVALLEENANPTDQQIAQGMNGNICRCNGYPKIVSAVRRAADKMRR